MDPSLRINIFLQSWKTSTTRLPGDLNILMKTTQKYNVCLNGFTLSQDILCEMPIWYHIKSEATRRMFNGGEQVKCLQMHHKVKTIKEVETLTHHLSGNRHAKRWRYLCEACQHTIEIARM